MDVGRLGLLVVVWSLSRHLACFQYFLNDGVCEEGFEVGQYIYPSGCGAVLFDAAEER